MSCSSLGDLAVGGRLHGVDEVGEVDSILDEEDWDVVSDNVEVALVGVAVQTMSILDSVAGCCVTHKRVANPWTSRTVSALPRDPATVEKRTKVGVDLPLELRNEAAVMLL